MKHFEKYSDAGVMQFCLRKLWRSSAKKNSLDSQEFSKLIGRTVWNIFVSSNRKIQLIKVDIAERIKKISWNIF